MTGLEIKLLRIKMGLKQSELSQQIGIPNTYLSLIENDKMEGRKYTPHFVNYLRKKIVDRLKKS